MRGEGVEAVGVDMAVSIAIRKSLSDASGMAVPPGGTQSMRLSPPQVHTNVLREEFHDQVLVVSG
jgi:hypothetical protein